MNIINKTGEFDAWLSGLKDIQGRAKIVNRIKRAELGNFGDVEPIGDGISEMRIDSGPGYRVYFARDGRINYLLLCGGDKPSQKVDIRHAKALWTAIKKESS
jgi:putative addiction module killer protein